MTPGRSSCSECLTGSEDTACKADLLSEDTAFKADLLSEDSAAFGDEPGNWLHIRILMSTFAPI
jgi:hypothetical protein